MNFSRKTIISLPFFYKKKVENMKKINNILIPIIFLFYSITFLNASFKVQIPENIGVVGKLVGTLHEGLEDEFLTCYKNIILPASIDNFFDDYLAKNEPSIFSLDLQINKNEVPSEQEKSYKELFAVVVVYDFIKRYNHKHYKNDYVNPATISSLKMLFPIKKTNSIINNKFEGDMQDVNNLYIASYECLFGGSPYKKDDKLAAYYCLAKINNNDLDGLNDEELAKHIEKHDCWDKVTNLNYETLYKPEIFEKKNDENLTKNPTGNKNNSTNQTDDEEDLKKSDDDASKNTAKQDQSGGRGNGYKLLFGGAALVFIGLFFCWYKYAKK